FTVYEAEDRVGGNAVTLRYGDFFFDSGAHRFHDRDKEITAELRNLLGEDFRKIEVPSKICFNGKFIDFPLSPLDLMKKLGLWTFARAGVELLAARAGKGSTEMNFREFAVMTYGKTMAEFFLLNYSEKLWGKPCDELSVRIAGKRMKGLDLKTFLKEAFRGSRAKTEHLDGAFYYPKHGFGSVVEKLAACCGDENIRKNTCITRIFHDHKRITKIELNGSEQREVDRVVSTLPLPHLVKLMSPRPPVEVLSLAEGLQFRDLIVVTVFIDRASIMKDGSVYFPESGFPFTRVYEPRNRSKEMSPPGKTSLCAEIPCFPTSALWNMDEEKLAQLIASYFVKLRWIDKEDIIDYKVTKLRNAYPVLETGFEQKSHMLADFFESFVNMKLAGRNGRFVYAHFHDMMRFGRDVIGAYISEK
ncbi:MAG: FAD-dependent oxidoreductase, partial [Thermodesulfovibrionales bacterium]